LHGGVGWWFESLGIHDLMNLEPIPSKMVTIKKWRFPEMGVPQNHPFDFRIFRYKPTSYWDPPVMETPKQWLIVGR
jgi:hypothetical protein